VLARDALVVSRLTGRVKQSPWSGRMRLHFGDRQRAVSSPAQGVLRLDQSGGIVNWLTVMGLSACGGGIVSVVAFCSDIFGWQQARRAAHLKRARRLPPLREYVDPWPDFVSLLTRIALGVIAGLVFRSQITTVTAAIALGASAPALLSQLGTARTVKIPAEEGTEQPAVPSIRLAEVQPSMSEEV
jgi:hypothetical protein